MITTKLTKKYQATIPIGVRKRLNLQVGDTIGFELAHAKVRIVKIQPFDLVYHRALASTYSEWNSPEDNQAYADL